MKLNLDVQTMRSFLKIIQVGGFSRAAEALRLTQPAISQQIKRLEELLDTELFTREGRSVRLTPAGEKLRQLAERFIEANDDIAKGLGKSDKKEIVHLGVPAHFSESLLPIILGSIRDRFPAVQLVIKIGRSPILSEGIDNGRIDLGLLIDQIGFQHGSRSEQIPVSWYSSLAESLPFEDGDEIPLVLFQGPCSFRLSAIQTIERSGRRWRCVYESEDLASLKAAVIANIGVTVLPCIRAYPEMKGVADLTSLPKLPHFEVSLRSRTGWRPTYYNAIVDSIAETWGTFSHKNSPSDVNDPAVMRKAASSVAVILGH